MGNGIDLRDVGSAPLSWDAGDRSKDAAVVLRWVIIDNIRIPFGGLYESLRLYSTGSGDLISRPMYVVGCAASKSVKVSFGRIFIGLQCILFEGKTQRNSWSRFEAMYPVGLEGGPSRFLCRV